MELHVIGCSGSVSGPDNPASCYLVRHEEAALVLDLGPGSFGALSAAIDPRVLTAVCLSHLHPDHCSDVCSLHVASRYAPDAPWPGIPILGPTGTAERLARLYEVDPAAIASSAAEFSTRDWAPEQQLGPFMVRTTRVDHPVEAYAIRIEAGGASLTYSGDTAWCQSLIDLAAGSDLLLAEASYATAADNPPHVHLTPPETARIAAEAGVGRLVLTHVPPWFDRDAAAAEAAAIFPATVAARPGLVVDVER